MQVKDLRQYLESRITCAQIWLTMSHVPEVLINGTGPVFESELEGLTKVDAYVLAEYVTCKTALTILGTKHAGEDVFWTLRLEFDTIIAALSAINHDMMPFLRWHREARMLAIEALMKFVNYYRGIHV